MRGGTSTVLELLSSRCCVKRFYIVLQLLQHVTPGSDSSIFSSFAFNL
jgi:hypothetical protein